MIIIKFIKKPLLSIIFAAGMLTSAYASDYNVEQIKLETPKYIKWENETSGAWSSVKKAKEYQIKLFLADDFEQDEEDWKNSDIKDNGLECILTDRVSEKTYDFSKYIESGHSYIFAVRATPKYNQQAYIENGDWVTSKLIDITSEDIGITNGMWRNYIDGIKYESNNGEYLENGWYLINGSWYYFDSNGIRKKGFIEIKEKTYYLDENGKMKTGIFELDENTYFADQNGEIKSGWIMIEPGKYSYFYKNGVMAKNCIINGYKIDSDGI